MTTAAACVRCHARPPWSANLCWYCHRAYAADARQSVQVDAGLGRGIVIGVGLVAGALSVGAPLFVAIAVVPVAIAFGSYASARHRRAWFARLGPQLPVARALPATSEPDSDTRP